MNAPLTTVKKAGLLAEFIALYLCLPAIVSFTLAAIRGLLIPTLLLVSLFCLGTLLRDRTFDRKRLWNFGGFRREAGRIVTVCGISGLVLSLAVWTWDQPAYLSLMREHALIWVLIMFL